jgi:hypothetical protein
MGRLDPSVLRYLTKEDFRIPQAIGSCVAMHARFHCSSLQTWATETGMKNHEYVPNTLIASS